MSRVMKNEKRGSESSQMTGHSFDLPVDGANDGDGMNTKGEPFQGKAARFGLETAKIPPANITYGNTPEGGDWDDPTRSVPAKGSM